MIKHLSTLSNLPCPKLLRGKNISIGWQIVVLLVLMGISDCMALRCEAQGFGTGRSRDSIFRKRRSAAGDPAANIQNFQEPVPAPMPPPPNEPQIPAPEEGAAPPPPPQQVLPQPVPQIPQTPPAAPRPPGQPAPGAPAPGQPQSPDAKRAGGIPPEGHMVLRMVPLEQKADVGQVFVVHVWLDNPEKKEFNFVSLGISYDPRVLRFIDAPGGFKGIPNSLDSSAKITEKFKFIRDPGVDPFYLNVVDVEEGMIYYRAQSASGEVSTEQGVLLTMKFEALAPILQTGLRFSFVAWPEELKPPVLDNQTWDWPDKITFIGLSPDPEKGRTKWQNCLGSDSTDQDGVISASLTLKSDDPEQFKQEDAVASGETRTRLYLEPDSAAVQVGKTIDIHVKLDNPERVAWDRIRFEIQFDPRYLKVVDNDKGNWISVGTNILDGPYHDRFPYEWMKTNMVRNEAGLISYECGLFSEPLRTGGTLATITFQGLKPTPLARVFFVVPKQVESTAGTVLLRQRRDVLGDTEDPSDGTHGASLLVVPSKKNDDMEEKINTSSRKK